jgi:hypothetical protein
MRCFRKPETTHDKPCEHVRGGNIILVCQMPLLRFYVYAEEL